MLYGLQVIDDHPCFKMQNLLGNIFFDYVSDKGFSDDVFPDNFSEAYLRRYGVEFKQAIEIMITSLPVKKSERQKIYSQFVNNNSIEMLCLDKGFLPENNIKWTATKAKKLKAFLLNCYQKKIDLAPFKRPGCSLKPTQRFYRDFTLLNGAICPFCGLSAYKNIFGPRREDLDHYLYKGKYPLAAANMWNLIPTCSECNQDYKKTTDVLYDGTIRTEAYYPYGKVGGVQLQLRLKAGSNNKLPVSWDIYISPKKSSELKQVQNWDRVYGITERYQNEIAFYHDNWMMTALTERTAKFTNLYDFRLFMVSRARVHKRLFERRYEPKSFLKTSFFIFVARHADAAFIGKYMIPFNAGI